MSDRTHAYSYGETEERESDGRKRTEDSQRFFNFLGAEISPNGEFFSNGQKFRVFLSLVAKFRNIKEIIIVKIRQILPAGSKKYRRILAFFFIFIFSFSQSWLNCLMDDRHFGYVTKLERKTLLKHSSSVFFFFSSPIL